MLRNLCATVEKISGEGRFVQDNLGDRILLSCAHSWFSLKKTRPGGKFNFEKKKKILVISPNMLPLHKVPDSIALSISCGGDLSDESFLPLFVSGYILLEMSCDLISNRSPPDIRETNFQLFGVLLVLLARQ